MVSQFAVEGLHNFGHLRAAGAEIRGQHLITVLPADHRADLQKLEKIDGEPASLETEEEFESLFPNCAKGAMRPFGNLYGLPTCVDKRLTQEDYIVFEAGTHTDAIKLNDRGYRQIVKPPVEDLAIKVHPSSEPEIAGQIDRVQCGCGLPLYRARIIFFSCRQAELEDLERWGAMEKS